MLNVFVQPQGEWTVLRARERSIPPAQDSVMKFGDLSTKAPIFVVLRQQVTFVTHCCIAVVASPYLTAYTFGLTWLQLIQP
jgi:hypothetical protein